MNKISIFETVAVAIITLVILLSFTIALRSLVIGVLVALSFVTLYFSARPS